MVGNEGTLIGEGVLRNPQNQLVELDLQDTGLEDRHLIVLAQLLPACKVKGFNFAMNKIESQGLLEFTRLIPKNALFDSYFSFL